MGWTAAEGSRGLHPPTPATTRHPAPQAWLPSTRLRGFFWCRGGGGRRIPATSGHGRAPTRRANVTTKRQRKRRQARRGTSRGQETTTAPPSGAVSIRSIIAKRAAAAARGRARVGALAPGRLRVRAGAATF